MGTIKGQFLKFVVVICIYVGLLLGLGYCRAKGKINAETASIGWISLFVIGLPAVLWIVSRIDPIPRELQTRSHDNKRES